MTAPTTVVRPGSPGHLDEAGRSAAVDGLRALAALSVFCFHLGRRAPALDAPWLRAVSGHLNLGVHVFFVLSGFLIFGPFAKALANRTARPRLGAYLAKRVARIWPAYLVALAAAVTFGPARIDNAVGALKHASLTYLYFFDDQDGRAVTVTWTLVVEWGFYLFVPVAGAAVALLPGRTRAVWASAAVIATGVAVQRHIAFDLDTPVWIRILPPAFATLGIGMLLGSAKAAEPASAAVARWLARLGRRPGLLVLVAGIAFAALVMLVPAGSDIRSSGGPRFLREVLQAVVAGGLVGAAVLADPRHWWPRALGNRVVAGVGIVSYGFYLWHVPMLRWLRPLLVHEHVVVAAAGAVAALGLTVVVATLSWWLVEKPALDGVGRALRRRPPDTVPVPR